MSKVLLQIPYSPDEVVETKAEGLEVVSSRMQGELEQFKAFANHVVTRQGPRSITCPTRRFPSTHCSGDAVQ